MDGLERSQVRTFTGLHVERVLNMPKFKTGDIIRNSFRENTWFFLVLSCDDLGKFENSFKYTLFSFKRRWWGNVMKDFVISDNTINFYKIPPCELFKD